MKLYKGLVAATVEALESIFIKNRHADRVVEQLLKSNKKWGARDRAFIAGNTYEIVRWWRLIKFSAGLDRVDETEEFWEIVGVWQLIKPLQLRTEEESALPDWPEFASIDAADVLAKYHEGFAERKIAQSIPDWIDELGALELGNNWEGEIAALNEQAPLVIRVNTLKASIDSVKELFGEDGTAQVDGLPDALILNKRQNVLNQEAFKQGFFEVQDVGSQLIAPYLDIQPGQSVIDACAGAGGKTLHIAALLQNEGSILAMDIEYHKLQELTKRASRNGVKNLETMVIQSDEIIEKLAGTADRLLLDVPCSGLGVLRRNPDSKWKLKPQFLEEIKKVQWHILTTYSQMVKPGGKMVYATCSILPSESENQVKRFMRANKADWKFISAHRTSPSKDQSDGFYMALLQKK
ncbi:RsmB/NOP family class I SAM-dependent RNA methyltransferase [Dyadobacter sp. CY326]|uniref:RsmB/NOP family class I SAM-dependent RNA methyltransferase n=1 Tax=Dyadobacter sp. CY326 TaxID=2907300 RepID=UPI001F3B9443|nr:class I SAM-dependent methyltransferase [Dyadobacter sp. CY326]MCE7064723.1 class I SAM-dependent methyltransferase [Dyadobacter sp. CY326]